MTEAFAPGLIAVPAQDWLWTQSALAIFRDLECPPNTKIAVDCSQAAIDAKRNNLVHQFLEDKELEWLCFIDSDMLPPKDSLVRLLSANQDVISAACFRRIPPYLATFGNKELQRTTERRGPWFTAGEVLEIARGNDPIISVDYCGTGFIVVQRRIFEELEDPWFECSQPGNGEDIAFCERLRKSQTQVWVDTRVKVGHFGIFGIDADSAFALGPLSLDLESRMKRICYPD